MEDSECNTEWGNSHQGKYSEQPRQNEDFCHMDVIIMNMKSLTQSKNPEWST